MNKASEESDTAPVHNVNQTLLSKESPVIRLYNTLR